MWLPLVLIAVAADQAAHPAPVTRPECGDRASDAFYFPKGWIDERREPVDSDRFARRWYSRHLRAMGEPSLSCGDGDGDAFRFLWLRTWGRPIAIRVHRSANSASVVAVELDGAGGYQEGKVSRRIERKLTDAEWTAITSAVRELGFWGLPTQIDDDGLDGAEWIFEGREPSRYHVVERWSPKGGPYREMCLSLLKLVGWLPSGKGKRDAIY